MIKNISLEERDFAEKKKNKCNIANGVNLHMAGKISDSSHYSEGCITVPVRCYRNFGVEVGFIKPEIGYDAGGHDDYQRAKPEFDYKKYLVDDFTGYIVIDRQYYENTEGYLKYNSPQRKE